MKFHAVEPNLVLLVRKSVGRSTFRGLPTKKRRPSAVFREWAYERLADEKTLAQLSVVKTHEDYDRWIKRLSSDLRPRWEKETGQVMRFGPSRKLPDLLMKEVIRWSGFTAGHRNQLLEFIHVPLDSYSLLAVRRCLSDTKAGRRVKISDNASMGSVGTEGMYASIQKAIREIAEEAGVPPIYIDLLAWNRTHKAV